MGLVFFLNFVNAQIVTIKPVSFYTGYIIDLAIVTAGVSVTFILNSYWEKVKMIRLEKKYLDDFMRDLQHDLDIAQQLTEQNRKKNKRAKAFTESIKQNTHTPENSIEVFQDIATINQFTPKMSAYVSIVNSGNLNIIRNYDLRNKLVSYYISFEEIKLEEKISNDFAFNTAIPFMYRNIDLLNHKLINSDCIYATDFKNIFIGYFALLQQVLDGYETLKENCDNLLKFWKTNCKVNPLGSQRNDFN
ncbi:hypothetical protein JXA84_10030 [candidate division WOR-3 bacterium]|nr:hypothetical protein [candidate division WOR-3 bacterium]